MPTWYPSYVLPPSRPSGKTTHRATTGGLFAKIKLVSDFVMRVTRIEGEVSTSRGGTTVCATGPRPVPEPPRHRPGRNSHTVGALRDAWESALGSLPRWSPGTGAQGPP